MVGFSISGRLSVSIGTGKLTTRERLKKNKIKMRRNALKILPGGSRVTGKIKLSKGNEIFLKIMNNY